MIIAKTKWIVVLLSAWAIFACNEAKYLAPDQFLYTGSTVHIKDTIKLSSRRKRELSSSLSSLLRPVPNSNILGVRFSLWVYNIAGTPKGRGIRFWLKNRVGDPPVAGSMTAFQRNRSILENNLENQGFFKATVKLDTVI